MCLLQILWIVNIDVRCKNVRALVVSCYEEHMARFSDLETVMITVLYQHSQYSHTINIVTLTICRVIYIQNMAPHLDWILDWIGLNMEYSHSMRDALLYISTDVIIIIHNSRILGQWQQHYSSQERAGKNNNCRYCL